MKLFFINRVFCIEISCLNNCLDLGPRKRIGIYKSLKNNLGI